MPALNFETLTPSTQTVPEVGVSMVASRFSRVVLPLPEGPIIPTNPPFCTSIERPSSALVSVRLLLPSLL